MAEEKGTKAKEEDEKSNKAKDVVDAVTGLMKAVPVYDDMVKPVAQQIGTALGTVGRAVNVALSPLSVLIWGYDRVGAYLHKEVTKLLADVPPEDIVSPKASIAGPAAESLRFSGPEPELREMYAKLLATAMNKSTANRAHPAFVEIIKQLDPVEAQILSRLTQLQQIPTVAIRTSTAGDYKEFLSHVNLICLDIEPDSPMKCDSYIQNFCRLGLMEAQRYERLADDSEYDRLEADSVLIAMKKALEDALQVQLSFDRRLVRITQFGRRFISACVETVQPKNGPRDEAQRSE